MKLNEKYIDFIRSNQNNKKFYLKKEGDEFNSIILSKKSLKNKDFEAIYYTSKDGHNDFSGYSTNYAFTINKKTLDILHVSSFNIRNHLDVNFFDSYDYSELYNKEHFLDDVSYRVLNLLEQKLEDNKEEFLKTINLDDYKEEILQRYKSKTSPKKIYSEIILSVDFNTINDFYTDKDKFIEDKVNYFFNKNYINTYKKYIAIEKGYEDYLNFLENDDLGNIKNSLIDIINNSKYKNIKINYTTPNGKMSVIEFSKPEKYYLDDIKTNILTYNNISEIPIKAIDSVTWGRSTLYSLSNEVKKKINYTEKEKIEDFINLKHTNGYPDYVYSDPVYIQKIYEKTNSSILKKIPKSLYNNKEFMEDFITKNNTDVCEIFLTLKNSDLMKDKNFIDFTLNLISKENYIWNAIISQISELDTSILNDLERAKKILQIMNKDGFNKKLYNIILPKFNKDILNDNEIINLLKQSNEISSELIPLFNKSESLLALFDIKSLQSNISYIDDDLLIKDKALLMTILDDMDIVSGRRLFANNLNNYINYYKNDDEVMNKVIKVINGEKSINRMLAILKLHPQYDKEKIYELSSLNINFLKVLNEEDIHLYFQDESSELVDLVSIGENNITVEAPFGSFNFKFSYHNDPTISYKDFNGHIFNIGYQFKDIKDYCLDFLNSKFPEHHQPELKLFISKNRDVLQEYIDNKTNAINNDDFER